MMGDVFGQPREPTDCLLDGDANLGKCSSPYDPGRIAAQAEVARIAETAGAGFVNPSPCFCSVDVCPTVIGSTVAFYDANHVTVTYADSIREPFAVAFAEALKAAR